MKNIFKVFSLALLVGAMFTLSSCKKDNQDLIIGKWSLVSATTNDDMLTQIYPMLIDHMTCEFTEDGTWTETANTGVPEIDKWFNGTTSYSVDGNKIIINNKDDELTNITIDELTKNSLTITQITETVNGVPTATVTEKYKRI